MLTSKELMEITGISRATLNNYIALGILAKPIVQQSGGEVLRTPRIGFFPDEAVARIEMVKKMKKEGLTMNSIAKHFSNDDNTDLSPVNETARESAIFRGDTPSLGSVTHSDGTLSVELSLDDLPGAAYMVNNNFELVWWNDASLKELLDRQQGLDGELEARNVFKLLIDSGPLHKLDNFPEILAFHIAAAKKRIQRTNLSKLYRYLEHEDIQMLEDLYERTPPSSIAPVTHQVIDLPAPSGKVEPYNVYIAFFREGILFTYVAAEEDTSSLLELLSRRSHVIRNILKKRKPFLTDMAVMVADLQNSVQICAELPPEDYFELINSIWQTTEPVFRKYYATHGKHVGDGMVYYFFPQPDCNYLLNALRCANELKEVMRDISRTWQTRKNWLHELHLNIGIDEGQEWFGTYHTGTNLEFTVLGDTINHAARISDFARKGSVWATKNMLSKLSADDRKALHFGIRRRTANDEEVFVSESYSRISSLVDLDEGKNYKFRDIATIPVTEVIDVTGD